jgi:hypothetical protein
MKSVLAVALLGVLSSYVARARACTADEYANEHFAEWDKNADGILSEAEVELSLSEAIGIIGLFAEFPQMRTRAHQQFLALDTSPPVGLSIAEFAAAASAYGLTAECADAGVAPTTRVAPTRRRRLVQAGGLELPGATKIPGLWHEMVKLRGDNASTVSEMTLFNSNQFRSSVKLWANATFAELAANASRLGGVLLQSVICGGQGLCSPMQLQIISGVGGLLNIFVDLPSVFLAKLVMYVVPSFSLIQTFQGRGAFGAELPSFDGGPLDGVPSGVNTDSSGLLDVVALLHIVPGADKSINKLLAGTARLPMYPSVALAHFLQDGGFALDFRLNKILNVTADSRGVPILETALHNELTAIATAYEELFEFDDLNANSVFDAGEPIGQTIKLGEVAWQPIYHTTSDGSCMTESDLTALDLGALRTLCVARGLSNCASAADKGALIAILEANPLGCPLDVSKPVILVVESRTAVISQFPAFSFAIQVGAMAVAAGAGRRQVRPRCALAERCAARQRLRAADICARPCPRPAPPAVHHVDPVFATRGRDDRVAKPRQSERRDPELSVQPPCPSTARDQGGARGRGADRQHGRHRHDRHVPFLRPELL